MSPQPLTLLVNGSPREFPAGSTVEMLLEQLGVECGRIAVAVNREIVPRKSYAARALSSGDRIEVLQAVGGG